jgi:hypothetical protein
MGDNGSRAKISLDGTDCQVNEPSEFSSRWFCHKHKCAGLRYEVGICIQTGWIVWTNGPYPCGTFPDITIARHLLIPELLPGEMFIADRGYRDGYTYADTPTGWISPAQRMKSVVRARHETVNSRIKKFNILSTTFRNRLEKHHMVFHAICNIIQLEIQEGATLYQIYYNDIEVVEPVPV